MMESFATESARGMITVALSDVDMPTSAPRLKLVTIPYSLDRLNNATAFIVKVDRTRRHRFHLSPKSVTCARNC
jgi:hypothetical protein